MGQDLDHPGGTNISYPVRAARFIRGVMEGLLSPRPRWTDMMAEVVRGNDDAVRKLLYAGAEIDAVDLERRTALIHAVRFGHLEIVRLLVQNGADVEAKDEDQKTPLMFAASNGNAVILNALLDAGARIDEVNHCGWTALTQAAIHGKLDIVKILLAAGADIELKDRHGWTATMHAVMHGHSDIVKALIDGGANIEERDASGNTLLEYSAQKICSSAAVVILMEMNDRGFDLNAPFSEGRSYDEVLRDVPEALAVLHALRARRAIEEIFHSVTRHQPSL